jgi:chromosome partitioning protein
MSPISMLSVSRETSVPGLDIIPSNSGMSLAERFLPIRQDYEFILKNAISGLTSYDFVILDCPPSLGAVTLNALTAADRVIAPTQPEYFSAYGLRSVIGMIRRVRGLVVPSPEQSSLEETHTASSPDLPVNESSSNEPAAVTAAASIPHGSNPALVYHILITMMDRRNRIHRTLCEQLQSTFGEGLLKTVIEVDTKLRESTVAGLPITHYYPSSRSAVQYRGLAQEIIQYAQEKTAD